MNIGVATVPCGNTNSPRRAELLGSVARIVNDTGRRPQIAADTPQAKPNRPVTALNPEECKISGNFREVPEFSPAWEFFAF
jgi:hypothetical protein